MLFSFGFEDFSFGIVLVLKDLISIYFILLNDMVYWRLCDLHGGIILSGWRGGK